MLYTTRHPQRQSLNWSECFLCACGMSAAYYRGCLTKSFGLAVMSCCCKRAKNYKKKCPLCTVFIRWRFAIEIKTAFLLYQGVNMFISTAGTLTWASWALTCRISLKWPFKELFFWNQISFTFNPRITHLVYQSKHPCHI